jgi:hypothetical protein
MIIELDIKISLIKFREGGQDIFIADEINQGSIIEGEKFTNPLIKFKFRELTFAYIMLIK